LVAETAAWALGEVIPRSHLADAGARRSDTTRANVDAIGDMATGHKDPLCRESAVAALGAIGDPSSLEHVLTALEDKPPIKRRAAVALAAFDDPRADEALERCLNDRDWQVRQAAEDLRPRP
jgi:HEAT repeat protein